MASLNLEELALLGRQFTWKNPREIPTYGKLEKILASTPWEHKFLFVSVWG
jgi:hypothetical protein